MIKKSLLIASLCGIAMTACISSSSDKLKFPITITLLTDQNYKPYSYVENGELKGLYIDVVSALKESMPDYDIQLQPEDWLVAKDKMRNGSKYALLGVYSNFKSVPYIYPFSLPINYERVIVICGHDQDVQANANWPNDYRGKLVANIAGYDGWLRDRVRDEKNTRVVNFLETPDTSTTMKMLLKGNVDCALFEQAAYDFELSMLSDEQKAFAPKVTTNIRRESVHIGYSEPAIRTGNYPYAYDFQKKMDEALVNLSLSGEMNKIMENYK